MSKDAPRLSEGARGLLRVAVLSLILVLIVATLSVLRHVQEVDDNDVILIEQAFRQSQQEHVVQVEGSAVLVYDRQGQLVYETTTQEWRENREEYTERFGMTAQDEQPEDGGTEQ